MTTIAVTIGWTKPDRAIGYSNYDGYRKGAEQHTETIRVEWTNPPVIFEGVLDIARATEALAEHVFAALNQPFAGQIQGLTGQIARLIRETGYNGRGAHYSLSVGDTVTVGEVMLACAPTGWERVR